MKKILLIILFLPLFVEAQISVVKSFQGNLTTHVHSLMKYNNLLFFYAEDANLGTGLWKSDGTTGGTTFVKSLNGLEILAGREYVVSGGLLYFNDTAGNMWRTDGTTIGTFSLNTGYNNAVAKIDLNGILIFVAQDADGQELWRSDGTLAGTYKVTDFYAGANSGAFSNLNMVKQANYVYFVGENASSSSGTLCRTDGTASGTQVVANAGAYISFLAEINGKIVFFSNVEYTFNCVGSFPSTGIGVARKIMRCENGICDILTNPGTSYVGDYPNGSYCGPYFGRDFETSNFFRKSGNKLFFRAYNFPDYSVNEATDALWYTDGNNSYLLKVFPNANSAIEPFYMAGGGIDNTSFDGIFYFPAGDINTGYDYEVWRSDGTITGTFLLKDIRVGSISSEPLDFRTVNGITYFTAHDDTKRKLFKTDGTTAGTFEVPDPNAVLNFPSSAGQLNTYQRNLWSNAIGNKFIFVGTPTTGSGLTLFVISPPPCETTLTLQSTADDYSNTVPELNGVLVKQASATNGSITATNKITSTAKVTYQAKSISLNNGFKADNGVVFKAEIGGCSN